MKIDRKSMVEVLHWEHATPVREDARILLLLAHFGKEGASEILIPKISQESLAEMVAQPAARLRFGPISQRCYVIWL
jgi:hypothetical protein